MGDRLDAAAVHWDGCSNESARKEIERANARLRHFRGIAASVMKDALGLWEEIRDALQDPRSCEEILDGKERELNRSSQYEKSEILEKFHLLGIHIDYARRLCEGSIGKESQREGEV